MGGSAVAAAVCLAARFRERKMAAAPAGCEMAACAARGRRGMGRAGAATGGFQGSASCLAFPGSTRIARVLLSRLRHCAAARFSTSKPPPCLGRHREGRCCCREGYQWRVWCFSRGSPRLGNFGVDGSSLVLPPPLEEAERECQLPSPQCSKCCAGRGRHGLMAGFITVDFIVRLGSLALGAICCVSPEASAAGSSW